MASLAELLKNLTPEQQHYVARLVASLPESEGGLGMPLSNTAMQRAKALGYTSPEYHATNKDISEFNPALSSSAAAFGPGTYTSVNPTWKASGEGANVLPLLANKQDILPLQNLSPEDYKKLSEYMGREINQESGIPYFSFEKRGGSVSEGAKQAGFSGVEHVGPGAHGINTVYTDPSVLRSRFAAFNPWRKKEANLLASHPLASAGAALAATGGLSGMAKQYLDQPNDPLNQYAQFGLAAPMSRGQALKGAVSAVPGIGEALSGVEGLQAASEGKWKEAGLGALGAAGMIPSGGIAGTFIGKQAAERLGKGKIFEQGAERLAQKEYPRNVWQDTLVMPHPTTKEPLMAISDAPAVYKGPQVQQDYIKRAEEKLNYLREHQKKYPQDNLEMEIATLSNKINDANEGYFSGSLSDFMEHPEFFRAHPELQLANVEALPTLDALGEYRGYRQSMPEIGIHTDAALNRKLDPSQQGLSVLLHEGTHAVSHLTGRPSGASPGMMSDLGLQRLQSVEATPHIMGAGDYDYFHNQAAENWALRRAQKYGEMTQRSGIKPSAIHRLADWYQYSNELRDALGPMPKRAGNARDSWMRNAFGILQNKAIEEGSSRYGSSFADKLQGLSLKDTANLERRLNRKLEKYGPSAQAYRDIKSKYQRLGEMSEFDRYQRVADEALARQTQDMMRMTEDELRQNYPMQGEMIGGVPVRDLMTMYIRGVPQK